MKLTIPKWLTPSGEWINKKGIKPTIQVELPAYTKLLIIDNTKNYQLGDVSGEVENLEKVFDALDYETGPIDGYLDEGTVSTIKKFQTDHELDVTGIVSGDTASAMIEDLRSLIKENDTQYEKGLDYLKK